MSFAYLATPYMRYKGGLEKACYDVRMIVADFAKQGQIVFSPIAYWHPIARIGDLNPVEHTASWFVLDEPFMKAASELIVVMLPGWQASKGILREIEYFLKAEKLIRYYNPEQKVFE